MFEDDQIAIASKTCTRVNHLPIGSGQDGITRFTPNVQAFVFDFVKTSDQRTIGRPYETKTFVIGCRCLNRWSWLCFGWGHTDSRTGRRGYGTHHHTRCFHRAAGWRHTQNLTDFNHIGVAQLVPAGQITPALAVVQANAGQGIAFLHGVVTWFARVFAAWHGTGYIGRNCGGGLLGSRRGFAHGGSVLHGGQHSDGGGASAQEGHGQCRQNQ